MVANLVAQNADKPGPLRRLAREPVTGLECGEESLLHEVFGGAGIAQLTESKVEKVITMSLDPIVRCRGGCFSHRSKCGAVYHSDHTYGSDCATRRPWHQIS